MRKVVMPLGYPNMPLDVKVFEKMGATFELKPCSNEDEIIALAKDADAIIALATVQPITTKIIQNLQNCRIIASMGIGYEGIDIATATERGICVSNTGDYCLEEVSDHAMALLLALARRLFPLDKAVKEGKWDSPQRLGIRNYIWPGMQRLRGQTVGLIGFGRIPRVLVPKAKGFGFKVIAYDPYAPPEIARECEVELVNLDRILTDSDYVLVHAAQTEETYHMLGLEQFEKMKPSAYIVNCARGGLIDHKALYTALTEGYIAGAGLDVIEPEPPAPDDPLFKLDNVIITAHSGFSSDQAALDLRRHPVEEIERVFRGEWPRNFVNPQVKEAFKQRWQD